MNNLEIYHPYKFYPSRTFILYSIIILLLFICFVLQKFGYDHTTLIYERILYLALIPLFGGVIVRIINIGHVKPLYGVLKGEIIFNKDSILIQDEFISIEDIKNLEFTGNDWVGLFERGRYTFENGLSNGTKNWLIIYLNNSTKKKIRFLKYEPCQLKRIKEVLIGYFIHDKISYLHMIDCLCLETQEEWNELKRMKSKTNN